MSQLDLLDGGYYFRIDTKKKIKKYDQINKFINDHIATNKDNIFDINLIYDVIMNKFYKKKNDEGSELTYDEKIEYIEFFYDPYPDLKKYATHQRILDRNSIYIYNTQNIKIKNTSNVKGLYIDNNLGITEFSDNEIYLKYDPKTDIDIADIYSRIAGVYASESGLGLKVKSDIINAAICDKKNFVNFFMDFNGIVNNTKALTNMFFNDLGESTNRTNCLKIMYDTATINVFFNLFYYYTETNNDTANIQEKDFFSIIKFIKDAKLSVTDNDYFTTMTEKIKEKNAICGELFNSIYGDFKMHNYYDIITNSISIEQNRSKLKNLSKIYIFPLIKTFISEVIIKNNSYIKKYADFIEDTETVLFSSNFSQIKQYVKNYINSLNNDNRSAQNKMQENNNNIVLGKFIQLIQIQKKIRNYEKFNRNSIFLNNNFIQEMNDKIKQVFFTGIVNEIPDFLEENLNFYAQEIKNTLNSYISILKYTNIKLNMMVQNYQILQDIVDNFNDLNTDLIDKIIEKQQKKTIQKIRNICFSHDFLNMITGYIVNFGDDNYHNLYNELVNNDKTIDYIAIIKDLPAFNDVINLNIGTENGSNSFLVILEDISKNLSSEINPKEKYFSGFISDIMSIIYYVNRIDNSFFPPSQTKNYKKFNIAKIIPFIYFSRLLKTAPLYASYVTLFNPILDIKFSNHMKEYKFLDEYLQSSYKSIGYTYDTGVPDCVESTVRDFINFLIMSPNGNLETRKLPTDILPEVKSFYEKFRDLDSQYDVASRIEWIKIFNNQIRKKLTDKYSVKDAYFFNNVPSSKYNDIKSSFIIFTNVLMIIFNIDEKTPLTYHAAQSICKNFILEIISKFNTQYKTNIIFKNDAQNTMQMNIDDMIFKIYDGHSLLESNNDRLNFYDIIKKYKSKIILKLFDTPYIPDNFTNYIYADENIIYSKIYPDIKFIVFCLFLTGAIFNPRNFTDRSNPLYIDNNSSDINEIEKIKTAKIYMKIFEELKVTQIFMKNCMSNSVSDLHNLFVNIPNINKYIQDKDFSNLFKYYFEINQYAADNIYNIDENDKITSFIENIITKEMSSSEKNPEKIIEMIIFENIEWLEYLFSYLGTDRNRNNFFKKTLLGMILDKMSNMKNIPEIDVIKLFYDLGMIKELQINIPDNIYTRVKNKNVKNVKSLTKPILSDLLDLMTSKDYIVYENVIYIMEKLRQNPNIYFSSNITVEMINNLRSGTRSREFLYNFVMALKKNFLINNNKMIDIPNVLKDFLYHFVPSKIVRSLYYISAGVNNYNDPKYINIFKRKDLVNNLIEKLKILDSVIGSKDYSYIYNFYKIYLLCDNMDKGEIFMEMSKYKNMTYPDIVQEIKNIPDITQ